MATEFRCNKCGKALFVSDPTGGEVTCPNCGVALKVPRPVTQPSGQPPPPPPTPGTASAPQETYQEGELSERAVGVLSAALPWGVSVLLHVSVFLVAAALYMARSVVGEAEAERIIIPDARLSENPGAMIDPGEERRDLETKKNRQKVKRHQYRKQPVKNLLADVSNKKSSDLKIIGIGVGAGGGPSAYGLSVDGGGAPKASFYGSGGNAYKICYVIDRSGSLMFTFDYLRDELKRSIRALKPAQQFHLIFFSTGKPQEMSAGKLVYATPTNKDLAFRYLDTVVPGGRTDPRPALERAFKYKPELIYFMTDGADFPTEVLDRLERLNRGKKVKINTFSFVDRGGEELLKQIAKEHGGRYTHVSEDDLGL